MKKLRVFETFAGIGAQTKALSNIGCEFEVVATSEWFVDAIIGYDLIHNKEKINIPSKDKLVSFLSNYTLSNDSKVPTNNISSWNSEKLEKVYTSIKRSNNLGSIMDIKGGDVPEHDLLTYSFPCQDLSIAGKGKGIERGSKTRSSLMWEVTRIISEMKESSKQLPTFLLMENVPAIQNIKYEEGLNDFKQELKNLGYEDHIEIVLNSSKLGIPQRRRRYFMISIHKDFSSRERERERERESNFIT